MTAQAGARRSQPAMATLARVFRDQPLLPLLVLLALLMAVFLIVNPVANFGGYVAATMRTAIPLAILAGCQTLVMLTGGIDLSIAATASMAGFVAASLYTGPGSLLIAVIVALGLAALIGAVNGLGVGVFRVHPLIMTLGMGLVILGAANAYQLLTVRTRSGVPPELRYLGSATEATFFPAGLLIFIPLAVVIIIGLRRTGYGRLLYAVGDNPIAARLSGVKSWQVLLVLYVISAILAAIAGFLVSGLNNVASVTLVNPKLLPSVAAAVIGGTSIFGGRGGFAGTIVGALILTVTDGLLSSLGFPEAVRQILFGSIIVVVAAFYARLTTES
jgi:ribose transport system permease protein